MRIVIAVLLSSLTTLAQTIDPATAMSRLAQFAPPSPRLIGAVRSGVVLIDTGAAFGSAFVVARSEGTSWMITNAHVVGPSTVVNAGFLLGTRSARVVRAQVLKVTQELDLALVRCDQTPAEVVPLPLDDRPASKGAALLVAGFPFGLSVTTQRAEEAYLTRGEVTSSDEAKLTFTGGVNPGNSGGPAIAADGVVEGVVTLKSLVSPTGVAIAAVQVRKFLRGEARGWFQEAQLLPLPGNRHNTFASAQATIPLPVQRALGASFVAGANHGEPVAAPVFGVTSRAALTIKPWEVTMPGTGFARPRLTSLMSARFAGAFEVVATTLKPGTRALAMARSPPAQGQRVWRVVPWRDAKGQLAFRALATLVSRRMVAEGTDLFGYDDVSVARLSSPFLNDDGELVGASREQVTGAYGMDDAITVGALRLMMVEPPDEIRVSRDVACNLKVEILPSTSGWLAPTFLQLRAAASSDPPPGFNMERSIIGIGSAAGTTTLSGRRQTASLTLPGCSAAPRRVQVVVGDHGVQYISRPVMMAPGGAITLTASSPAWRALVGDPANLPVAPPGRTACASKEPSPDTVWLASVDPACPGLSMLNPLASWESFCRRGLGDALSAWYGLGRGGQLAFSSRLQPGVLRSPCVQPTNEQVDFVAAPPCAYGFKPLFFTDPSEAMVFRCTPDPSTPIQIGTGFNTRRRVEFFDELGNPFDFGGRDPLRLGGGGQFLVKLKPHGLGVGRGKEATRVIQGLPDSLLAAELIATRAIADGFFVLVHRTGSSQTSLWKVDARAHAVQVRSWDAAAAPVGAMLDAEGRAFWLEGRTLTVADADKVTRYPPLAKDAVLLTGYRGMPAPRDLLGETAEVPSAKCPPFRFDRRRLYAVGIEGKILQLPTREAPGPLIIDGSEFNDRLRLEMGQVAIDAAGGLLYARPGPDTTLVRIRGAIGQWEAAAGSCRYFLRPPEGEPRFASKAWRGARMLPFVDPAGRERVILEGPFGAEFGEATASGGVKKVEFNGLPLAVGAAGQWLYRSDRKTCLHRPNAKPRCWPMEWDDLRWVEGRFVGLKLMSGAVTLHDLGGEEPVTRVALKLPPGQTIFFRALITGPNSFTAIGFKNREFNIPEAYAFDANGGAPAELGGIPGWTSFFR